MQRLFGKITDNKVKLSSDDLHHLFNVKRYKVGEKLEVVDGDSTYLCEVKSVNPIDIEIINKIEANREISSKISLAFVLLKGDHNSLIVEKCTEVGCSKFYPLTSDRCVIKAEIGNDSNRIERLKKIIKGASEQSRRDNIPEIEDTQSIYSLFKRDFKNKVIAYEGLAGSSKTFLTYLNENKTIDDLLILIGPEGGFSTKEVDEAIKTGFIPVSLGKTILRGETACICATNLACTILGENNE